jgi:hypothetical protein
MRGLTGDWVQTRLIQHKSTLRSAIYLAISALCFVGSTLLLVRVLDMRDTGELSSSTSTALIWLTNAALLISFTVSMTIAYGFRLRRDAAHQEVLRRWEEEDGPLTPAAPDPRRTLKLALVVVAFIALNLVLALTFL